MNAYYQTVLGMNDELLLLQLDYPPANLFYRDSGVDIGSLRPEEKITSTVTIASGQYSGMVVFAVQDLRVTVLDESIINICKTVFVAVILTMGNLLFAKDVNQHALNDINRMLWKVKEIATNPLSCKDEKMLKVMSESDKTDESKNETILIENTITHIGELLALSFGELGSSIIAQNLALRGHLDLSQPGKKTFGIFGCIDIL